MQVHHRHVGFDEPGKRTRSDARQPVILHPQSFQPRATVEHIRNTFNLSSRDLNLRQRQIAWKVLLHVLEQKSARDTDHVNIFHMKGDAVFDDMEVGVVSRLEAFTGSRGPHVRVGAGALDVSVLFIVPDFVVVFDGAVDVVVGHDEDVVGVADLFFGVGVSDVEDVVRVRV